MLVFRLLRLTGPQKNTSYLSLVAVVEQFASEQISVRRRTIMISVISKSANLAPYLRATSQVVASGLKPAAAGVTLPKETVVAQPGTPLTSHSLGRVLPRGPVSVVSGPTGTRPDVALARLWCDLSWNSSLEALGKPANCVVCYVMEL